MKSVLDAFTHEQQRAITSAARAAGVNAFEFVRQAVKIRCADMGVPFPEAPAAPVKPYVPKARREAGGRPRKPLPEMERHVPSGAFERVCKRCLRAFRTDNDRTAYCSEYCEKGAAQDRHYQKVKQAKHNAHDT